MPNVHPDDLPIAAARPVPGFPCGSNTCVDLVDNGDTFAVRSTRRVEMTPVVFDADEMVKFLAEVKAGEWDHIEAAAKARQSELAPI